MTLRKKTGGGGAGTRRGGDDGGHHPIQQGIEKLYAAGKTPRIRLDARRNDVVVPEHVRERWQDSLVIDLDPGYPLNLAFADDGVHCDLAFAGHVSRCTFAWPSIYGLFDRASGQGVQIAAHLPKAELPEALRVVPKSPPKKVRALSSVKSDGRAPERPAAPETPAPPERPAAPTPEKPAAEQRAAEKPVSVVDASDELARARRAKFRVITGG